MPINPSEASRCDEAQEFLGRGFALDQGRRRQDTPCPGRGRAERRHHHGEQADRRIRDHGVWYAIELLLNRDASFYLDTRNLRPGRRVTWRDKTVLNTFAYTGSLGVAAQAGGASRVVHLDRSRDFLNVAKTSYTLNGFPIHKTDFQTGDFFTQVSHLKRAGERFDCVLVDPPFFSTTSKGTVDLVRQATASSTRSARSSTTAATWSPSTTRCS